MKCIPTQQHMGGHMGHMGFDACCCPGMGHKSHFLSKKKKVEMLQKHVDGLKEQIEDIEAYIAELKEKKQVVS